MLAFVQDSCLIWQDILKGLASYEVGKVYKGFKRENIMYHTDHIVQCMNKSKENSGSGSMFLFAFDIQLNLGKNGIGTAPFEIQMEWQYSTL